MRNSNAAGFSVEQRLFVKTEDKKVQVVIFPKWTKEVEGTLFTNIDFLSLPRDSQDPDKLGRPQRSVYATKCPAHCSKTCMRPHTSSA